MCNSVKGIGYCMPQVQLTPYGISWMEGHMQVRMRASGKAPHACPQTLTPGRQLGLTSMLHAPLSASGSLTRMQRNPLSRVRTR